MFKALCQNIGHEAELWETLTEWGNFETGSLPAASTLDELPMLPK